MAENELIYPTFCPIYKKEIDEGECFDIHCIVYYGAPISWHKQIEEKVPNYEELCKSCPYNHEENDYWYIKELEAEAKKPKTAKKIASQVGSNGKRRALKVEIGPNGRRYSLMNDGTIQITYEKSEVKK